MASTKHKKIELDATAQSPGRLATQIARILMGKHKTSYEPHVDRGDRVLVTNVDKVAFTGKKFEQKVYRHHTMHPGGLKETPVKKVIKEDPEKVVRLAVMKMLPKNKFRTIRMRRIMFS